MANKKRALRYLILATLLLLGVVWSLASAEQGSVPDYPNGDLMATPQWLDQHAGDDHILIVDVRTDEHFDGRLIPGAIRLPWSLFRYNKTEANEGSLFVGVARAQEILGSRGIGRTHTIILYDSVARDGGATASYLFWILDILGHESKKILNGGIDAWESAGYDLVSKQKELTPILYQAPMQEIRGRGLIDGDDVYSKLGDLHYQIIDVRSPEEYKGEKGTRDLQGNGLKMGHIPTAVNIDYTLNWRDTIAKKIKSYSMLQDLYRGLDTEKTIIVYCNSGRRSSFSYYVLRLMGIDNVLTYEPSWKQWGKPANFFPVETVIHSLVDSGLPGTSSDINQSASRPDSSSNGNTPPKAGYVSCGG
ncbi:MAG: sulfurtransferase [Desulfobacterales bacterium]|nr:sulfurtransferase [Desulfobacterales bacterium]